MLILIAAITFMTVFLLLLLVLKPLGREQPAVKARLGPYMQALPSEALAPAQRQAGWRGLVRYFSRYFEAVEWTRVVEHRLIQAGLPLRGAEFMVICLAFSLTGVLLAFIAADDVLMWLLGALGGFLLPLFFLRVKIGRRTKAFNQQLGDVLTLIANSLRTGYSFMQALDMVSREMLPPIAVEFGRVLKEINLGVTTEEALNNLAKRVDSEDLDLVITAVLIQRQVGGNLAEVLTNISGTIRERVRIKGEIRSLTAQGRISGIVVGLLPVAVGLALMVINPDYLQVLFHHPVGRLMLVISVLSQLIGVFLIRKIVTIEM